MERGRRSAAVDEQPLGASARGPSPLFDEGEQIVPELLDVELHGIERHASSIAAQEYRMASAPQCAKSQVEHCPFTVRERRFRLSDRLSDLQIDSGAVYTDILQFRVRVLAVYGRESVMGSLLTPENCLVVWLSDRMVPAAASKAHRPAGPAVARAAVGHAAVSKDGHVWQAAHRVGVQCLTGSAAYSRSTTAQLGNRWLSFLQTTRLRL